MAEAVRGAPRYLDGRVAMGNPKMRTMADLTTRGVLKKKICDLEQLMLVPEATVKSFSRDLNMEAS